MDINFSDLTSLYLNGQEVQELYLNGELVWQNATQAFTIKTRSANNVISTTAQGWPDHQSLEYSTDGGSNWSDFTLGSTSVTLSNVGDTLQIRAKTSNGTIAKTWQDYWKITATEDFDVEGSMNSLLRKNPRTDSTSLTGSFYGLFDGNTHLIDASKLELPWTYISTTTSAAKYEAMFRNCTGLTTPPELPATTLDGWCYKEMFKGCSSLTSAPTLPATEVPIEAYYEMFCGCTALTVAPALPATSLTGNRNYYQMFNGCSSLATPPPSLPATIVPDYAYQGMFEHCTSLTTPPTFSALEVGNNSCGGMFGYSGLTTPMQIPTTTVGVGGFYGTFYECASLTTAPALPATSMAQDCYREMFQGCISLVDAPELPATSLESDCYNHMFYNCSSLKTIRIGYTGNFSSDCFNNWVVGVASSGTFYYNGSDTTTGDSAIPTGWTAVPDVPAVNFKAKQANSTIEIGTNTAGGSAPSLNLEYSTDGGTTWSPFVVGGSSQGGTTITLTSAGQFASIRATSSGNTTFANAWNRRNHFVISGLVECSGDILYLLNQNPTVAFVEHEGTSDLPNNCFAHLFESCAITSTPYLGNIVYARSGTLDSAFSNCTSLTTASDLSKLSVAWGGKSLAYMFKGCTSLVKAPEIGIDGYVNIGNIQAFYQMFYGCTGMVTGPSKLSTSLSNNCYQEMFKGCTSLTSAPILPASAVMSSSYKDMFRGCTSLVNPPSMTITSCWENGCESMFHGCTNLTSIPTLSVMTLSNSCFKNMFYGCTSLTDLSSYTLPATESTSSASACYGDMFNGCTSLTAGPNIALTTFKSTWEMASMFTGCTSLTASPHLHFTNTTMRCCSGMFNDCTSLQEIKLDYTGTFGGKTAFTDWVKNVSSSGTFYFNGSDETRGTSTIPSGWTIQSFAA